MPICAALLSAVHFSAPPAGGEKGAAWVSCAPHLPFPGHLAGAAVENSMLGAAHACANPLTARYGITHGVSVGIMLPHVIQFNKEERSELYQGLGISLLQERIVELKSVAGLEERLRDLDVRREDFPRLAAEAAKQWTGKFNPRPVNEMELLRLYELAY